VQGRRSLHESLSVSRTLSLFLIAVCCAPSQPYTGLECQGGTTVAPLAGCAGDDTTITISWAYAGDAKAPVQKSLFYLLPAAATDWSGHYGTILNPERSILNCVTLLPNPTPETRNSRGLEWAQGASCLSQLCFSTSRLCTKSPFGLSLSPSASVWSPVGLSLSPSASLLDVPCPHPSPLGCRQLHVQQRPGLQLPSQRRQVPE
jgi:hypothetical protein